MSNEKRRRRLTRAELLKELAHAGRANSDATVFFHSTISQLLGLNPTDYKTMSVLQRVGPMSAGEIARHTGLATASVTDLIDRLESKGMVSRIRDVHDRRRILVMVNPDSVEQVAKLFKATTKSLARLYDRYSDRELEIILDFLSRNASRLTEENANLTS